MSLISVIMPSYNVKNYISECMESVCNQTYKEIEILSIDAGSSDGTLEILHEYEKKDSRINVILSERKSYGYQVNKGIEMAQGEYVVIIETDDVAAPDMLECLYKPAREYDLDYVKGDYAALVSFEDGTVWKQNKRIYPLEKNMYGKVVVPWKDPNAFLQDVFLWRGIYKKEFLIRNDIKLNETDGAAYQDVGFLFQTIAHAERAMYISDIVYNYRQNNAGSSVYNPKAYDYLCGEYPFIKRKLEEKGLFNTEMKICYYIRLFTQIVTRYRMMAVSGCLWENTEKQRLELWNVVDAAYSKGYLDETLLGKGLWLELQQYLVSEEAYWQYQLSIYNGKRKIIHDLLDKVNKAESIVFYSRSLIGGFVYCLLKATGLDKNICFCDNDETKQGISCMNIPILSVKDAVTNNPNAIYIIANRHFDQGMRQQLMDFGINKSQIYVWMLDTDILLLNML